MPRRKFGKGQKLKQSRHAKREMTKRGTQVYLEGMSAEEARKFLKGAREEREKKKPRKRKGPKRIR